MSRLPIVALCLWTVRQRALAENLCLCLQIQNVLPVTNPTAVCLASSCCLRMSRSFREKDIPKIQKDEAPMGCRFGVGTGIHPQLFVGSRRDPLSAEGKAEIS